jgi:hypothetical protein
MLIEMHISIHQPLQYFQKEKVEADRMKGFHLDIRVVCPDLSRKITLAALQDNRIYNRAI